MKKMKTGIVIIHYNDFESVKNLIDNIKDYKILDYIIIYDNHSREDVIKKLKTLKSSKVEVIINSENKGYAYAINDASKHLIKRLGKCNIIISNSDIIIDKENDIVDLIHLLNKRNVGLVAPTILEKNYLNRGWKNPTPLLDSMMNLVYIHRFFRKKYIFYNEDHYTNDTSFVDVASGCFFLIRSDTLEKINYLDENTFLYYEENILAKKLASINKKELLANDIIIIHNHSVSIDKNVKKIKKLKLQKESQYYFQKNYNNANIFECFLLKATAFISRVILTVVYFMKDVLKNIKG